MGHDETNLLGPFIGYVTDSRATIWLQLCDLAAGEVRTVPITLHELSVDALVSQAGALEISDANLGVGVVSFDALTPDTVYYYRLWQDPGRTRSLDLQGLEDPDLHFRTLPEHILSGQLDFLLMSCHNPGTSTTDGKDGFAVWARIPEILRENEEVRFALLAGDQVYGDEIEAQALEEPDNIQRQKLYLGVYRKFWGNIYYRKTLCSLPAYMMWDDHDITDGWGSREDSFTDDDCPTFKPEWNGLFDAAKEVFTQMQASRNPPPLSNDPAKEFDFYFRIGRAGFAVPDLRSNRNKRLPRIMRPEQLTALRKRVEADREHLDVLFFVSTVVFSHGAPTIERGILKYWLYVLDLANWLKKYRLCKRFVQGFDSGIGDLRDDINDSWGADVNAEEADRVLDFLFELQNPGPGTKPINVVILSGDIHTPGYATLYSADQKHINKSVIPHITATPVAYEPFTWFGEAVYRHLTRVIDLGEKGSYTAQVSHHFCHRNVVVCSYRKFAGARTPETQLKVKYYLEGFPEPQIMLFDLNRSSHREGINWPQRPK